MSSLVHPIIFIRGLSLCGDDRMGVGLLTRFVRMQTKVEKAFRRKGVNIISVENLGLHLLEGQLKVCKDLVEQQGFKKFHILTHSMGGLVARMMSHDETLSGRIESIVTIAAPHYGSLLANKMVHYDQICPWLYQMMRVMGSDINMSVPVFSQVKTDVMASFNRDFPFPKVPFPKVPFGSIVCDIPLREQGFPLQIFHRFLIAKVYDKESLPIHDGLIEKASQSCGQEIGEYTLDHLSQLGFHFYLSSRLRKVREDEFQRMVQDIIDFMALAES